ncbi:hypothetical protein CERZMDRAFT_90653, partial [Cercospora zeae-maydis SCOH1-5]
MQLYAELCAALHAVFGERYVTMPDATSTLVTIKCPLLQIPTVPSFIEPCWIALVPPQV